MIMDKIEVIFRVDSDLETLENLKNALNLKRALKTSWILKQVA